MSGKMSSKGFTSPKLNPDPKGNAFRPVHVCIIVLLCNMITLALGKQTEKNIMYTWDLKHSEGSI